ncbi:MAG TPA: carbohydrate kinase, partial [Rhizobiaceae bacterium]|nr:carbohydrate kinase [Rhizobiaceae bacterium]
MSALFLGIDIGTSGVRAIAIDAAQAVAAQASARMADFSSDHRDPAGWRGALHSALSGLFA